MEEMGFDLMVLLPKWLCTRTVLVCVLPSETLLRVTDHLDYAAGEQCVQVWDGCIVDGRRVLLGDTHTK